MTLAECISFVDAIEPNAYTNDQKTAWVNECEGRVWTDVFLMGLVEYRPLDYTADKDRQLDVKPPHDKLYPLFLQAKVHFANGEYTRYGDSMALFNEAWGEFVRWFARTYSPAEGYPSEQLTRG